MIFLSSKLKATTPYNYSIMSKPVIPTLSVIMVAMQLLIGCTQYDATDLNTFVEDTKAKHAGQIEPLPMITPYESYRYDVEDERDPFKISVSMTQAAPNKNRGSNGLTPNSIRNKEELERFSLNTLSMVGVLNNDGLNWAIIKAPDNSIFRVREGNYMGENHGKIVKISESSIQLKEIVSDGMGGWLQQDNTMTLSE